MKKVAVMLPLILTFNYQQRTLRPFDFAVYKGLLNLISFGSLLYFTMGAFASDFKRINSYFDIFEILIIPLLVYNVKNKKLILPFILYFGAIALSKLYSSVMIFEDLLDPFYFIFDQPFDRYIY